MDSYLCFSGPTSRSATLFQWTKDAGGSISGTYRAASITGTAPGEQVTTGSGPIYGQMNGSEVSVDFGGTQMYGKLASGDLTLNAPQQNGSIQPVTCKPGGANAWNQALTILDRAASTDNQAAKAEQQRAKQQKKKANDYQTAQNDQSTLQQAGFASDISALTADVKQANSDLATLKADASHGTGSYCDNVYGVNSDVYSVNSDTYAVTDDVRALSGDVGTVRQDITTLKGDLQTLANEDVAAPPGAAAAIASAQDRIAHAVTTANADIDQMNADEAAAYSVANALATGSCSGAGPGSPPTPISHI